MGKSSFNDTYVTSRYEAWSPVTQGWIKEIVTLTNDRKKRYEEKGWKFRRTTKHNREWL